MSSTKVTEITSPQHLKTLTSTHTYTVIDFYADWCGPCKTISPLYAQLSNTHAAPSRLAFVKVNVDSQREIAQTYNVSAMPTFLILKGSVVAETIRGADAGGLKKAVEGLGGKAGLAGEGKAFGSGGRRLGGQGEGDKGAGSGVVSDGFEVLRRLVAGPAAFAKGRGWVPTVVRFVALYAITLFSFEPVRAAEGSGFAVGNGGQGGRRR